MRISTCSQGGFGVTFQGALVSKSIGLLAQLGIRNGNRIDSAQIRRDATTLFNVENFYCQADLESFFLIGGAVP